MPKSLAILPVAIVCSASAHADDPAWNVRNAAEKLIDKHALRLPADDWFLQRTDGSIVQYFKPTIVYSGKGGFSTAEVRTAKWRERKDGTWSPWYGPGNGASYCLPAVVEISTPSTGGAFAKFAAGYDKFTPFRAPGQSWVTHIR